MDFFIDMGFAVLLRVVKDERQTRKLKSAFLKLYNAIGRAYPNDPDFHPELKPEGVDHATTDTLQRPKQ